MEGSLTIGHWIYIITLVVVLLAMILKRDVVVPCILGILLLGWSHHGSLIAAVQTVFQGLLTAGTSLFNIMLIIALMVAMLKALQTMGADVLMVSPVRPLMKNPKVAYWVLGAAMYAAALFFWPTPATALVAVILLPIAVRAGLPPIAAAMSVNIFGHGMALSGDLVIQGAPGITARAAGIPTEALLSEIAILSLITGLVAGAVAYLLTLRDYGKKPTQDFNTQAIDEDNAKKVPITGVSKFFAVFVPAVLLLIIVVMVFVPDPSSSADAVVRIRGGLSEALLGGTATLLMLIAGFGRYGNKALEEIVGFLREGLLFAAKIFAPVIPIAGFFLMGSGSVADILGEGAPQYLFDIGNMIADSLPLNAFSLAFGNLLIGILTGLDGSGFSGLPLVGGLAQALGGPAGVNVEALAAVGQMGAVWIGGGTLAAWSFGLVATAGVAGINPIELARRNFIPVVAGLVVSTLVAILFMM
ncbi:MAG: hypothetical protein FH749_04945 [Firmicutes bacterium]|nr:hypothetical protein [Bacillota bacterium]